MKKYQDNTFPITVGGQLIALKKKELILLNRISGSGLISSKIRIKSHR